MHDWTSAKFHSIPGLASLDILKMWNWIHWCWGIFPKKFKPILERSLKTFPQKSELTPDRLHLFIQGLVKSVHLNDDFFSSHLYRVSENLGFWKYRPIWIAFETFIISKVFIISPQSHQACSRWYYSIWPRLGQEKGCLGNASQIYLISPTFRKLLRTDLHRKTLFSAFWFSWMIKQIFFSPFFLPSIIKQTYKYENITLNRLE